MSDLLKFPGVPLITGARSWKGMGMAINPVDPQEYWPQTGQTVAQAFPRGLFLVVVTATRSDDMPCRVAMPVSGEVIRDPENLDKMLRHGWHLLNTYRDCDCTPTTTCRMHVQAMNRSQQEEGGDDVGDGTAAGSDAGNSPVTKLH
jgi:hypothetical protein